MAAVHKRPRPSLPTGWRNLQLFVTAIFTLPQAPHGIDNPRGAPYSLDSNTPTPCMEIVLFWLLFSIAVGAFANSRGRSGFGWFTLSALISPLLGFIFCAIASDLKNPGHGGKLPATHVKCAACAEPVLREATKCKHCGSTLTPQPVDKAASRKAAAKQEITFAIVLVSIICAAYFWAR